MSDLVGNPEDRFSQNEAQIRKYKKSCITTTPVDAVSEDQRHRPAFDCVFVVSYLYSVVFELPGRTNI